MNQIPIHNVGGPFNQLTASRNRLRGAKEEGILLPDCLRATASSLPWVSSLPAHPEEFRLANLHKLVSQFLTSCPLSLHNLPPPPNLYLLRVLLFCRILARAHGVSPLEHLRSPAEASSGPAQISLLQAPPWSPFVLSLLGWRATSAQTRDVSTCSEHWEHKMGGWQSPHSSLKKLQPFVCGARGMVCNHRFHFTSPADLSFCPLDSRGEGTPEVRVYDQLLNPRHSYISGLQRRNIRVHQNHQGVILGTKDINSSGHIGPAGLTWDLVQGSIQSNLNIFVAFSVKSSHFSLYWFESHHYISNLFIYRVKQYQFSWTTWNCQHWDIFNLQKLVISCDPIGSASMNQDL